MPRTKLFYGKRRKFTGNQHTGPILPRPKAVRKVAVSVRRPRGTMEPNAPCFARQPPYQGESAMAGFELRDIEEGFFFTLTSRELAEKCIHVKYCSASDKYIRVSDDNKQTADYRSCLYRSNNMYRKEEYDWNMVYLARDRGNCEGDIQWRFDFAGTGLVIDHVTLVATAKLYQNGHVKWSCGSHRHMETSVPVNEELVERVLRGSDITGKSEFNLAANLSGGQGDVAYQHAQLFRTGLEDYDKYPLDIKIQLKKKD